VKRKLYASEVYKMSITNILGSGQQKCFTEVYREAGEKVNLLKKNKVRNSHQ